MTRSISVLIVRHGEREDEAIDHRQYRKMTPGQRFDPSLTPQGFAQAQAAFDRLGMAIADKFERVAVFSSPLRRAVGTATMISLSACASVTSPSFVLPAKHDTKVHVSPSSPSKTMALPIVIWDGLCDCAAQVERLGGNKNAVRTGFLHCAANQDFQDNDRMNKLQQALSGMGRGADLGLEYAPQDRCPFQLWRVNDQNALVPMAPQMNFFGTNGSRCSVDANEAASPTVSYRENELPIDQVVRMAMDAGCDACIVVSHREEIRELYKYRCGYRLDRRSLPYCCIGRFEVVGDEQESNNPLEWIMHDVSPFEAITEASVVPMLAAEQDLGKMFEIAETSAGASICAVRLVKDSSLPFEDIESCSVTSSDEGPEDPSGLEVQLDILKGRKGWYQFFHLQDPPVARMSGKAFVRLDDNSLQEKQIAIHVSRQPGLPCPPKYIRINVLF